MSRLMDFMALPLFVYLGGGGDLKRHKGEGTLGNLQVQQGAYIKLGGFLHTRAAGQVGVCAVQIRGDFIVKGSDDGALGAAKAL